MKEVTKMLLEKFGLKTVAVIMWNKLRSIGLTITGQNIQDFRVTQDLKFKIDFAAKDAFSYFTIKSPEMINEMKSFIRYSRGKKNFLDIGALYGIFSLTFLVSNQNNSKAFAIEPSPKCQQILKIHKKLNPELDFHIFPIAFGESNGQLTMHYEWHHLVTNHQSGRHKTLTVNGYPIDEFINNYNFKPDLIKIDVEGFEYKVLTGGIDYLSRNNPLIFLELHKQWISKYGNSVEDVINLLLKLQYAFYHLDGSKIENPNIVLKKIDSRIICSKEDIN